MRPCGTFAEVRQTILQAVQELATPERAPTLTELAARACVGKDAARRTVDNMRRSGQLAVPRMRKVDYRNRPVAEYAPAERRQAVIDSDHEHVDVAGVFAVWAQG